MSKTRNKTTALPERRKLNEGRQVLSRSEREERLNRIVILVTAIGAAVVVVILGIALFVEGVVAPNRAVASAGGESISARDFETRVRFERYLTGLTLANVARQFGREFLTQQGSPYQQLYNELASPTSIGNRVLEDMLNELVAAQYARENNITVSKDEVDQEIFRFFGYDPTGATATPTLTPTVTLTPLVSPTPTSTPTPSPSPTLEPTATSTPFPTGIPTATLGPTEEFERRKKDYEEGSAAFFKEASTFAGLSEADVTKILTARALRNKVQKAVLGEKPTQEEKVKARHILVKSEAEAQDVLAALQAGESFSALAAAVSQDPGSKDSGGELDWTGRGTFVKEFEDAVFNAPIGAVIGPINTTANGPNFGYHIIQVEGREMRTLTDSEQETVYDRNFTKWLNDQRAARNAQTFSVWIEVVPSRPSLADFGLQ